MPEAHLHLFGEDYLVEVGRGEWLASVPCFCGTGARPTNPTDWHWHEVARAETWAALLALLNVRQVIDASDAA